MKPKCENVQAIQNIMMNKLVVMGTQGRSAQPRPGRELLSAQKAETGCGPGSKTAEGLLPREWQSVPGAEGRRRCCVNP